MTRIVMSYLIPATITVDTVTGKIIKTEMRPDNARDDYSIQPELLDGSIVTDDNEIRKATKIAEANWPWLI